MVQIKNEPYVEEETSAANHSNFDGYFEWFSHTLSDFQKHAIRAIVEGNHVLITAHTGSGKTLPAEFAIRYFCGAAAARRRRIIYTSPIKALSNQKFYEFTRKFSDAGISFGIITGDIKCNPDADVLIMTTEILLNHLMCAGAADDDATAALAFQMNIQEELAAVVFDEVHYINDQDRGKVWEQTILMLPPQVQLIMLSATIDAPEKFATWVETRAPASAGAREVVLSSTETRVVPLTHYGYMITNEGYFKSPEAAAAGEAIRQEIRTETNQFIVLQNSQNQFQDTGYLRMQRLKNLLGETRVSRGHMLNQLTQKIRNEDMLPAIVFVFSRKMVERMAQEITVNLFLNPADLSGPPKESNQQVPRICEQILRGKLSNFRDYLQLPEYVSLVALLEKGVAIHHSGMLPILREIVEFMISQKYVKLLFATESFAIGLDCPIRTAVFSNFTKFDGKHKRFLHPHEYSQMAGRAGRRGMDTVGHVIHCNNLFELPTQTEYRAILGGNPQKLVSKFYINPQLLLRLYETETEPEPFVRQSMISRELNHEIEQTTTAIITRKEKLALQKTLLEYQKTPRDICEDYLFYETSAKTSVNKKRRDFERKLQQICDKYPTAPKDVKMVAAIMEETHVIDDEMSRLEFLEGFFKNKIKVITDILINYQMVVQSPPPPPTLPSLTPMGKFAAHLNEIHPVILVYLLEKKWEWFAELNTDEIISLLSCFTETNPIEELSQPPHQSTIQCYAQQLRDEHLTMGDMENQLGIDTGFAFHDAIKFDMIMPAYHWARGCTTEEECKLFLQTEILSREISVGDFTKAILKISNIARELIAMVGDQHVEFVYKLSAVDEKILKYIVTMQSLYI